MDGIRVCHVALGDTRNGYLLALRLSRQVGQILYGWLYGRHGPSDGLLLGAKAHLMFLTKALIAIGELAFAIAGAREIEVVAIANGFAKRKGFQLGVDEFGVFPVISNSLQPITWTAKA